MSDLQKGMESQSPKPSEKVIGRNEPCPCGSGKKYKRCHGVDAAPVLTTPKAVAAPDAPAESGAAGMDPAKLMSQMDPQTMAQMSQMLQRLPRGQMQKLQQLMHRAMSGKDVTKDAAEFEKMLSPQMKETMQALTMQMMPQMAAASGAAADASSDAMSAEEARRIVEKAAAEGKIDAEQAQELLAASPKEMASQATEGGTKLGRLWKKISGKAE